MCSETDDFFEPALKGTISTVMHFVVNMMDQMGYSNSSFANALLNNDKSYDFYSIVVNYYHDISNVEATVKSILEGKLHYDLYQLNNIVQTETVKLRVIDTNYIEIATIANAITPANIHHIDVIKSFLSDLLDQSKIDTHAKEQARKQIKEKVDQIKAYNTPQQLFTPQEQTNQTLQPKTEDFIKLLSIPYQNRKEDCKKLLDILTQSGWSKKDHARFALALYKSGNVALQRENIRTFAEWWRICCDIFGWEGADSPYKESQLTPNKATRQISLYL
jgi:hypothetical protein